MNETDVALSALAMVRAALDRNDENYHAVWDEADDKDALVVCLAIIAAVAVQEAARLVDAPPKEVLDSLVRSQVLRDGGDAG